MSKLQSHWGSIRQSCSSEQKSGRENLVASELADTVRVPQSLFIGTRIGDMISALLQWGNMRGNSRCTRDGFHNDDNNLALPFNLHQPPQVSQQFSLTFTVGLFCLWRCELTDCRMR